MSKAGGVGGGAARGSTRGGFPPSLSRGGSEGSGDFPRENYL